eukprot:jgi/Tetstr1/454592/TSEL_041486.t1
MAGARRRGGEGMATVTECFTRFRCVSSILLVALLLASARGGLPQEVVAPSEGDLLFTDVLATTAAPWDDLDSVAFFPQPGEQPTVRTGEDCAQAGLFATPGTRPDSVYKTQLLLRQMKFVDNCTRARQVDAVFLGDSAVSAMGGVAWREMCDLPGGCANFGVRGQTVEELQYAVQRFTTSCLAPKAFVINIGADALLRGAPVSAVVGETKRVVTSLRNHFCHSAVLLTGLLPLVERANYETYRYKNVTGGSLHYAKITTINGLLGAFADARQDVHFVNCHDLFLDRINPDNIDRLLLEDGIHMSQPGQRLFARCLQQELTAAGRLAKTKYGRSTAGVDERRAFMASLLQEATGASYAWRFSRWGPCSDCDEGGVQLRTRECIRQDTGEAADELLCEQQTERAGTKGASSADLPLQRACTSGCPTFHWVPRPWGECSVPCGGGTQSRRMVCMNSLGRVVAEAMCARAGGSPAFVTVQNCNTHSCAMSTTCSSDDECPANAQCAPLRCDGGASACARWSAMAATLSAEVRTELSLYLAAPRPTGAAAASMSLPKGFEASLKHGRIDDTTALRTTASSPVDRLPMYLRYRAYSDVRDWDGRRCYEHCQDRGDCLATSSDGQCMSWGCGSAATCDTSRPDDFHVPGVAECLFTGGCRPGGCACTPGFTGPGCEHSVAACPAGAAPSSSGCCFHSVDIDGTCCPTPRKLDAEGRCCASGRVDACGVCDGRGAALDVMGQCCAKSIDAAGRCCDDGVDECGVCNGDGSSCAYRASGTMRVGPGVSVAQINVDLRRNLAHAVNNSGLMNDTNTFNFLAVEGLALETDGVGQSLAASIKFVVFLQTSAQSGGVSRDNSLTGAGGGLIADNISDVRIASSPTANVSTPVLLADFERLLRRRAVVSGDITNITDFRRSGVCGNGLCEIGESMFAGALSPNTCREDCPFDDSPNACDCGANGLCVRATGACLCRSGFTGTSCDQCDLGFTQHAGQCVPVDVANAAANMLAATHSSSADSGNSLTDSRPISDPLVIALIAISATLFVAHICLVVYHVRWMRKNADTSEPPTLHENPLNSVSSLNSSIANP